MLVAFVAIGLLMLRGTEQVLPDEVLHHSLYCLFANFHVTNISSTKVKLGSISNGSILRLNPVARLSKQTTS